MADATIAIMITLDPAHEGGFQKNPNDHANWTSGVIGEGTLVGTNGGITALDMPGVDIEHLTIVQKVDYYIKNYWKPYYSQIASQDVANKLFDLGVLFGVGTAAKALQAVLGLTIDGLFGPNTLFAVNETPSSILLPKFKDQMTAHAKGVALANPHEAEDLNGWLRRIAS